METQGFKFDVALIEALNKWVTSNMYLMSGVVYPDRFIEWERDKLTFQFKNWFCILWFDNE